MILWHGLSEKSKVAACLVPGERGPLLAHHIVKSSCQSQKEWTIGHIVAS